MRNSTPDGGAELRRTARIEFKPDRHYVKVQRPDDSWDGPQLDSLMDQMLPDGSDAYTIEADGSRGVEDRRKTGHRNMVVLSCPKEYAESQARANSNASREAAYQRENTADDVETTFAQKGDSVAIKVGMPRGN